ncbi:GIY-YIG nuclease family protein [Saccharicrinis aurantiacus]|uniref:GIY-YIG nuclease family protein n=1 Tax=Saccharicrinis aurantiacus TaxID=1849719 RepID=UPI0024937B77|nr:GIY-YIG nuclease family protein [Saccharicrinis aurantiacus]
MYTVYAIASNTRNYIYVGMTSNLSNRLERHNQGYERTTKPYAPFTLIYSEEVGSRPEARVREKYWKSGLGKERLRLVRNELDIAGLSADR